MQYRASISVRVFPGLVMLPMMASALAACNWISLAGNALTYDTVARGEASNIAVGDSFAYVSLAEEGLGVVDARTGFIVARIAPAAGAESVDDLATSDELLFALDARPPGWLSVYSLREPTRPRLVDGPRAVDVGPFSGVSARDGMVVVSGGTSRMSVWRYDAHGALSGPRATADLGRGQPDVLLGGGRLAFFSTHYWGPYFGVDVVRLDGDSVLRLSRLALEGAGFTKGGSKPANFPIEMALLNDSTLLVAHSRGLAIVDIADPAAPRLRRIISLGGPAVNVDAGGSFAVVAIAGEPAVAILDSTATVVRHITLPPGTNPGAVAFLGTRADRVLVAARDRGVMVLER